MKKLATENFISSERESLDKKSLTYVAGQSAQDDLLPEFCTQIPLIEV